MRCTEKVDIYCMQAIKYKKYAEVRRCEDCCIDCLDICANICSKALEIRQRYLEGRQWK